jgi:hypothetical protein
MIGGAADGSGEDADLWSVLTNGAGAFDNSAPTLVAAQSEIEDFQAEWI